MKYIYPAVFTEAADGGYSINFPDIPSCYTQGDDMKDGMEMAEDVLALTLYRYEVENMAIPEPSNIKAIKIGEREFASFVICDTIEYRKIHNNKAVKKTLTIPEWLNEEAVKANLNFSQVLQEALQQKLNKI